MKDGFYVQEAPANIQKFYNPLKLDEFIKLTWVSEMFWHIQQLKYIQTYSVLSACILWKHQKHMNVYKVKMIDILKILST